MTHLCDIYSKQFSAAPQPSRCTKHGEWHSLLIMQVEPDVVDDGLNEAPSAEIRGNMDSANSTQHQQRSGLIMALKAMWDVDAADVKSRCITALDPSLRRQFLTNGSLDSPPGSVVGEKQPDMWGPVWIYQTVVFAMFFSATFAGILSASLAGKQYEYNASILTGAAGLMLVFTFGVPVVLWLALQFFNLTPTLTLAQTVCLCGYSNVIWVPAVLVAGSPLATALVGITLSRIVRWGATFLGFVFSSWFIYGNVYKIIFAGASNNVTVDRTKASLVLGVGVLLHAVLAFMVLSIFSLAVSY